VSVATIRSTRGDDQVRAVPNTNARATSYVLAAGKTQVVHLTPPSQALRGVRAHRQVKLVVVFGSSEKSISVRRP
jgi:hypothetical protein